jgi:hypothetical protein
MPVLLAALVFGLNGPAPAAEREIIDPQKVCPKATDPTLKIDAREVCTLLVVVRNTLEQLRNRVPASPELSSVSLNLKAETKRQAGGEITIFVVKFGAKTSADTVQTLDIKFPLEQPALEAVSQAVPFSTSLANSIVAAFKAIDTSGIGLKAGTLSMSVKFGVSRGASGGASIALVPITVSAAGGVDSGTTQELVFKFGKEAK